MTIQQDTFGDILNTERQLVLDGAKNYGAYFVNADQFGELLLTFTKGIDLSRHIFAGFLASLRKHYTLALFSAVRLHHIQALMDLRQVLECGAAAAYAIAHPEGEAFYEQKEGGNIETPKRLTNARNQWLEANFKTQSDFILKMKESINESVAHANIVYAMKNFKISGEGKSFETPFFDFEDEYHVKTDLWMMGNIALGLMDLFYGVDKTIGSITFKENFLRELKSLEAENHRLKVEMQSTDRFKKAIGHAQIPND